jgi:hypothetical protein
MHRIRVAIAFTINEETATYEAEAQTSRDPFRIGRGLLNELSEDALAELTNQIVPSRADRDMED